MRQKASNLRKGKRRGIETETGCSCLKEAAFDQNSKDDAIHHKKEVMQSDRKANPVLLGVALLAIRQISFVSQLLLLHQVLINSRNME